MKIYAMYYNLDVKSKTNWSKKATILLEVGIGVHNSVVMIKKYKASFK